MGAISGAFWATACSEARTSPRPLLTEEGSSEPLPGRERNLGDHSLVSRLRKMPPAVMLSGAKDLHLPVFKERLQMLRSAQHDR